MATERLKTVKPSGGDYTSLAAAIAGEAGDLVSADEWLHIECYAMTDTAQVAITGFTTSADCHILIDVPMSERHQGVWDSNKYNVYYNAYTININISTSYVVLEGLQSYCVNGDAFRLNTATAQVRKCIGRSASSAFNSIENGAKVYNCLAFNSRDGFYVRGLNALYNCTAVNCSRWGISTAYINTSIYNCLAYNSGTADYVIQAASPTFTLNNCASSDGTADDFAGSGNRVNQTFSFVDAANGDYHLAENDAGARGYGLTNPGSGLYLDDIDSETRTAPWDIGADQYVSGDGGKVPIGAINRYYRTLMGGIAR